VVAFEGEGADGAFDEANIEAGVIGAAAGDFEHCGRGVDSGHVVARGGEFEGDAAGAAADFQDGPIRAAGEREPEADVFAKAAMDGVVVARVYGIGVVRHRSTVRAFAAKVKTAGEPDDTT
jgi:hypothetical protein